MTLLIIRFNFWFNNFKRTASSPIVQKTYWRLAWLKVDQFNNIPPIGLEMETWFVSQDEFIYTSKFIVLERNLFTFGY
ncbi:MAG: hypothetical protein ACTS5F_01430 [Candidatus Hodgkinia cicadicola]